MWCSPGSARPFPTPPTGRRRSTPTPPGHAHVRLPSRIRSPPGGHGPRHHAGLQGGSAINRVLVRKNVIVRMGTPRFLRQGRRSHHPGDRAQLPRPAKQMQLSLDINGLDPVAGAPQSVTCPAKAKAPRLAGEGITHRHRRSSRQSPHQRESDALELTFPVEPAGVPRTISIRGVITDNSAASATIDFPANTDAAAHTSTSRLPLRSRESLLRARATSPAIPMAAPSRPCPASCPT